MTNADLFNSIEKIVQEAAESWAVPRSQSPYNDMKKSEVANRLLEKALEHTETCLREYTEDITEQTQEIQITALHPKDHLEYFKSFLAMLGKDHEGNEYIAESIQWKKYDRNQKLDLDNTPPLDMSAIDHLIQSTPLYKLPIHLPEISGYETKITIEKKQ